uniref:Uncharacterized protein n=1 Tax=Rhizophora mucronata TaxID=61149 RepID=A0A2P2J486_RHIMU
MVGVQISALSNHHIEVSF